MKPTLEVGDWQRSKVLLSSDDRREIAELCRSEALSIQDLARKMGLNPGSVHNHVHRLHDAGFLRIASTRKINGIVEKKYVRTGTFFSLFHVAEADVDDRNKTIAKLASKRVARCLEKGPRPAGLFDISVMVSEERLAKLSKLANELQQELLDADGTGDISVGGFLVLGETVPRKRKKRE